MKTDRTYWFGRKRFGFGYGPRTWEGWAAVLVYGVLMVFVPKAFAAGHHDVALASMVVLTIAFLAVFFCKLDTSK